MKKIVLLAFVLVFLSTAVVVRSVRPVIADGTIYIRPDGSMDPPTAPIQRDGNIYRLASDLTKMSTSSSTNVSGGITANTTWTLAGSPYVVVGNVVVEVNVYLRIEPGVIVRFTNGTDLIIDGALIARGNSTHPVTFTSNATIPNVGDWGSIRFRDTSIDEACIIDWATIEYASTGVTAELSSPRVENSVIQKNTIGIEANGAIRTYNNTIINNYYGVRGATGYTLFTISNSLILGNVYGIGLFYSRAIISESTISGNQYGIYSSGYLTEIVSSNVSNNNHGILASYASVSKSVISNNNGTGIGDGEFSIMYSTISGNQQNGIVPSGSSNIHFSGIYDNTPYDVYSHAPFGIDVNATHNWWGTTNTTLISQKIYDYYDDYELGRVLHEPFLLSPYFVAIEGEIFYVDISSNSTIANFSFDQLGKYVSFCVTGPNQTIGFCNVTIPKELLWGEFSVFKDDSLLVKDVDYTETFNGTHYIFYITYVHTTHTIKITGTEVIPEFPTWTSMLFILMVLTVAIAIYKRKLLKTQIH